MDETPIQDERWRELADLLGLPPEKSTTSAKPAPAPAPRTEEPPGPPPVISEAAQPPPVEFEEESPRMEPAADAAEASGADWEADFDSEEEDTAIDESQPEAASSSESSGDETEVLPRPEGDDDKPRRGRRRRRRGRRRGGEREEGEARPDARTDTRTDTRSDIPSDKRSDTRSDTRGPTTPADGERRETPDRPARERSPEPRDRREPRQQRGGRRDEEERRPLDAPTHADVEAEPDDVFENEEASPAPRALALEDTDFTNWNVPSWQDLIASLYRPDR